MERRKKIIERVPHKEKEELLREVLPFLTQGKFVNVATCSLERMPNVAPKMVAKAEKNIVYLVDYVIGRSYANLKENPRVSISFMDELTLTGYQLNGSVSILDHGDEFLRLSEEFQRIKTNMTVEHILYNVRTGQKKGLSPEFHLPQQFAIFKVKVIEIVEISSSGHLKSRLAIG